jgi:succinate dehydrogenase cytochrome b556 subunit/succinate dehydrogenase hydrophobic membrane anchor protein
MMRMYLALIVAGLLGVSIRGSNLQLHDQCAG